MSTKITQPYVWLPTELPGCRMWLDASSPDNFILGGGGGTSVIRWKDKTQYINSVDAIGLNFPVYNSNTLSVNFNAGSSNNLYFFDNLGTLNFTAENHTLIGLTNPSAFTTDTNIFNIRKQDSYVSFPYSDSRTVTPHGYVTSSDGIAIDYQNSMLVENSDPNQKNIIIADISSVAQNVYKNGSFISGATETIVTLTMQQFYIGGMPDDAPAPLFAPSYYTGAVHEILFYDRSISTNERQQIEGYLAWKWNIQDYLPPSHPYKNFPPFQNNLMLPQALNAPIRLAKIHPPGNQLPNASNKIFLNKNLALPNL